MDNIDYMYEKFGLIRLSSNQLKVIAMITMLIDHIGFMIIGNGKLYGYSQTLHSYVLILDSAKNWLVIYRILRVIGRISFPIYTFCVVEGFLRTHNLFKYILRLLILAIMSEIPFNLMCFNKFFSIEGQNVIWLYVLGLISLSIIKVSNKSKKITGFVTVLIVAIATFLAYYLKIDYGHYGMILLFFIYFTRNDKLYRDMSIALISFFLSFNNDFGSGALSTLFIHYYDGTKGRFDLKWLFYLFYPVHMLILFFVVWLTYTIK